MKQFTMYLFKYLKCHLVLFALSGALLINSSCKKANPNAACVSDPLNNLSWLKSRIQTSNNNNGVKFKVYTATYKSIDGFLIEDSIPPGAADMVTGTFVDCSDNNICTFGGFTGGNCQDFSTQSSKVTLIYSNY